MTATNLSCSTSRWSREQIRAAREAARSLAQLPRKRKRRWTGWIDGRHCWRDQEILLPDGSKVSLDGAVRQQVIFTLDKGRVLGGFDGEPRAHG